MERGLGSVCHAFYRLAGYRLFLYVVDGGRRWNSADVVFTK
ncbi:MAG: hypothetical protein ACE15F_14285 [bacterium]